MEYGDAIKKWSNALLVSSRMLLERNNVERELKFQKFKGRLIVGGHNIRGSMKQRVREKLLHISH